MMDISKMTNDHERPIFSTLYCKAYGRTAGNDKI